MAALVQFSEEAMDAIAEATRYTLANRSVGRAPLELAGASPAEAFLAHCTSSVADTNGNYPALVARYDGPTLAWVYFAACKLYMLNGGAAVSGVYYFVQPAGTTEDGDALYAALAVGGGNLAGLQSTDCVQATGPSGSVTLTYSGGAWVSTDALSYPGDSGLVTFWFAGGALHCSLGTTSCGVRELLNLGNGCFAGGPLTGHGDSSGGSHPVPCTGATFTVCLRCVKCPGVSTTCCPDYAVPKTLYVTVTGGGCPGVYTLTYFPDIILSAYIHGVWATTDSVGSCGSDPAGLPPMVFCSSAPGVGWYMIVPDGTARAITGTCSPFSLSTGSVSLSFAFCGCSGSAVWTVTE